MTSQSNKCSHNGLEEDDDDNEDDDEEDNDKINDDVEAKANDEKIKSNNVGREDAEHNVDAKPNEHSTNKKEDLTERQSVEVKQGKHEFHSTSQNFVSRTIHDNSKRITGYDEGEMENEDFPLKKGSPQNGGQQDEDTSLSCSLSTGKIDNVDRRERLISSMENAEEDYSRHTAANQQKLSHDKFSNAIQSTVVGHSKPSVEETMQADDDRLNELGEEDASALQNMEEDADRIHERTTRVDKGENKNIGSDDGAVTEGIHEVTKMYVAPLSKIQGDNPGHVFYGNDDDNDDDDDPDESKNYVPLKTAIPPVRTPSLDNAPSDTNDETCKRQEKLLNPVRNEEQLSSTEGCGNDVETNTEAKKLENEANERNQYDISSNFGDFPDEYSEYNRNFNENSKNDKVPAGDESQIPSSSSSVPVPFPEALSYRRAMQCPVAMEREEGGAESASDGTMANHCTDQSTMINKGNKFECQNEKTISCALKSAGSVAGMDHSEEVRDEIDNSDLQRLDDEHSVTQNLPRHTQNRSVFEAEVSVHTPSQHSQELPKDSKESIEHSYHKPIARNDSPHSHIAATASTSVSGLHDFSLSGMLPFSDQTRLVNTTPLDEAMEEFNLVYHDDADDRNDTADGAVPGKSGLSKMSTEVADPGDCTINLDVTDAGRTSRRRSVAESARDWLVEWTEMKGTPAWTSPLHERLEAHRQKVLTQKTTKASGFVVLTNTKRKRVQQLQNWWDNVIYTLALWGKSIRRIEGVHGSGVASYFLFLRWLFGLNIVLFALMVSFTTVPMAVMDEDALEPSTDPAINTSYYCSEAYVVEKGSGVVSILEFIQGTGWMEKTYLFYGYYVHALEATYNLPLAYMLTVLACLIISLVLMARYTGKSFREALLNAANTNFEYSNKVFGAWDYSLTDTNAAEQKQKGIHDDIQGDMLEQTFMRRRIERLEQKCSRCKLYTLRLVINFFILIFLGAAAYLIFFVTSWSTEYAEENKDATGTDAWLLLLVQYLPSIAITVCNVVLPLLFEKVVVLEDYSQAFVIQITLIRTVFLRLASLIVLVISLYSEISCTPKDSCNANTGSDCTELKCWETYVGQQFYKLAITDFIVVIIKVFLVELPRRFAVSKCNCGLFKALGPPEFNIPANVLDLVYGQCLVWVGFLFCPLMPGLNVAKLFIFFYVKKLSALVACPPSDRPYKASRINTFFMVILLVAFSLCALPVMYSIFSIEPSKGCGPFLLMGSMNQALEDAVDSWPSVLNIMYDFLMSTAVTTIVIIFLAVAVYYLRSIGKAHKQQAALYREQLIMEGRDKQFLMSKLQEMYMPGQKGKQPQDKDPKKKNKKDNVEMVDERGGYPSKDNPPNPYSPPNEPVYEQGDW